MLKPADGAAQGKRVVVRTIWIVRTGERDFSDIVAEGGEMVEPLRDPDFFARVFLEYGTLVWPNGFDLDAIALHDEMKAAGLLRMPAA